VLHFRRGLTRGCAWWTHISATRLGTAQRVFASSGSSASSGSEWDREVSGRNKVVLSRDGNAILCWHPEPEFPYEYSRPMPRNDTEMQQGDSALKVQYIVEERTRYRPDGPNQQELMQIFHTTRHLFDHKPRMKYLKPNPPKPRDGI